MKCQRRVMAVANSSGVTRRDTSDIPNVRVPFHGGVVERLGQGSVAGPFGLLGQTAKASAEPKESRAKPMR